MFSPSPKTVCRFFSLSGRGGWNVSICPRIEEVSRRGTPYRSHHGIALAVKNKHPEFFEQAAKGGFDINGAHNGINVPKEVHKGWPGWHRDMDDYADSVLDNLENYYKRSDTPDLTPEIASMHAQFLSNLLRQGARRACEVRGLACP